MKTRHAFLAFLLAAALCGGVAGCDEAREAVICSRLASDVCDKWFECYPTLSATRWTTTSNCADELSYKCSHSESLYGCDLDNSDLFDCEQKVDSSVCGSMPQSCQDMLDCYY